MPDIVNSQVIRFSNEQVRPMSEILRAFHSKATEMNRTWNQEIAPAIAGNSNGDSIADGRGKEGVSALDKADQVNFMAQVQAILNLLNGAGVMDVVTKPAVRAPGGTVSI